MARLALTTTRARTLATLRRRAVYADIVEANRILKERDLPGMGYTTFYRWKKGGHVMLSHVAEVLAELHGYRIVLVRADRCAAHRGDST